MNCRSFHRASHALLGCCLSPGASRGPGLPARPEHVEIFRRIPCGGNVCRQRRCPQRTDRCRGLWRKRYHPAFCFNAANQARRAAPGRGMGEVRFRFLEHVTTSGRAAIGQSGSRNRHAAFRFHPGAVRSAARAFTTPVSTICRTISTCRSSSAAPTSTIRTCSSSPGSVSMLKENIRCFPPPACAGKMARQWVLNGVLPTPRIEFEPSKDLTLYVGANIKQTNFRVDDNFGDAHGIRGSIMPCSVTAKCERAPASIGKSRRS